MKIKKFPLVLCATTSYAFHPLRKKQNTHAFFRQWGAGGWQGSVPPGSPKTMTAMTTKTMITTMTDPKNQEKHCENYAKQSENDSKRSRKDAKTFQK